MTSGTINVGLADDHRIVRQGLRLVLEQSIDFKLAGEAADGLAALDLVRDKKPDVLVVDLMLPRLHGLEVVKQVAREHEGVAGHLAIHAGVRAAGQHVIFRFGVLAPRQLQSR